MGDQAAISAADCSCECRFCCSASSSPTTWRRSVKRKLDPAAAAAAANEAARALDPKAELEELRETVKSQEEQIQSLCDELDEERNASATAANETMAMILRLQGEKAAAQMEARQFKRFADERIAHDDGELEDLELEIKTRDETIASLSYQIELYRDRMKRHGIDPDTEAEDGEKGVVEQPDDNASDRVYTIDAVYQHRKEESEMEMSVKKIVARLEALESDRENLRRDAAAMRTEKMQLVLLRDIARRLCGQVAAERRVVKKSAGGGEKFSVVGVFKWVFNVFFSRGKSHRGPFGLQRSSIGFLLLLGLSTRFGQSRGLPGNRSGNQR